MKANNIRAFTLIELLVVISIIGLLSGVITASLNTAREKGRIGAARQFAAQVEHIAGEQAVGIWELDECSGTLVSDRSGFGNNGSLPVAPSWLTDTPSGKGCSIAFTGTTNIVSVPDSVSLSPTTDVTVSVWTKISALNAYQNIVSKGSCNAGWFNDSYVLCVHLSGNAVLFYGTNAAGTAYSYAQTPITAGELGKWIHITGVMDSAAEKILIYKNGVLASSNAYTGGIMDISGPLVIGGDGGAFNFTGSVDEARVYAKALTASEIGRLYAEGERKFRFAEGN